MTRCYSYSTFLRNKEEKTAGKQLPGEGNIAHLFSTGSHLSSLASQTSHTFLSPLRSHSRMRISASFSISLTRPRKTHSNHTYLVQSNRILLRERLFPLCVGVNWCNLGDKADRRAFESKQQEQQLATLLLPLFFLTLRHQADLDRLLLQGQRTGGGLGRFQLVARVQLVDLCTSARISVTTLQHRGECLLNARSVVGTRLQKRHVVLLCVRHRLLGGDAALV